METNLISVKTQFSQNKRTRQETIETKAQRYKVPSTMYIRACTYAFYKVKKKWR